MRWLGVLALIGACSGRPAPPPGDAGAVSLELDIPHGMLDPRSYATVEIVLHEPTGDVTRTATVDASGHFSLDRIDPSSSVSIEATLRNSSGAAVGYGRTAVASALAGGAKIVVPVRRPIAYIAGMVGLPPAGQPTGPLHWTQVPATYSDLSAGAPLDGTTQVGNSVVLMVAAGPSLYMVTQAVMDPSGALTGPATILPVSTADHTVGAALTGTLMGAVVDGAGSDDGTQLAIGTSTALYAIDTASGAARALTPGSFARVAIVTGDTGELTAVAIKNRGSTTGTGTCPTTAEIWWAPLTGAAGAAHLVATGGFSDIAADRGHAYYVDACKGELGEVTATATRMLRTVGGTGVPAGKPTALAVSSGQAYIGIEGPPPDPMSPATASLVVASIASTDAPRTLWTEAAQQVLDVTIQKDVQRQLSASAVVINHLEIGAGGDYVALTTSAPCHAAEIDGLFPDMQFDIDELQVFAAATGGIVQRYRGWCHGIWSGNANDIGLAPGTGRWECTAVTGQSAPAGPAFDHRIGSMTFQFGKK
ncbi:MAG TPA: hypothetical protein VF469_17755 [Kofleriaceae bacterium]